jgi:hypothetical protein
VKKSIRVSDYVDTSRIELIAQCEKSELGYALLEAARRRSARIVAETRLKPRINCEVIEEDIRYKLGQADEADFLQALVIECQREVTK